MVVTRFSIFGASVRCTRINDGLHLIRMKFFGSILRFLCLLREWSWENSLKKRQKRIKLSTLFSTDLDAMHLYLPCTFFHDGAPLIEQRTEGESGYVLATYVPAYFLDFNICSFQSYWTSTLRGVLSTGERTFREASIIEHAMWATFSAWLSHGFGRPPTTM